VAADKAFIVQHMITSGMSQWDGQGDSVIIKMLAGVLSGYSIGVMLVS